MKGLYHYQLGLPKVQLPQGVALLEYTGHAKRAANDDRYGVITLPVALDTSAAKVIEVEVDGNAVTKVLYRVSYDHKHDLCLAVIPRRYGAWLVKTVWLNRKDDTHRTLDEKRYTRPQ